MATLWKNVYRQIIDKKWHKLTWDDKLVLESGKGHTKETAQLDSCHNVVTTALWYSLAFLGGEINEGEGVSILEKLEDQQIVDQDSPHFGCMRWYSEEGSIYDTNGAFFVQRPLLISRILMADYLPSSHKSIIDRILDRGGVWFAQELANPIFYYSNKILSDGAMLMAIASITGNAAHYQLARKFFLDWIKYTNESGWGWGENLSIIYNGVIFFALKLALVSLAQTDSEIRTELEKIISDQLDLFYFFNGYELTPAIRNYNFTGQASIKSILFTLAGVDGFGLDEIDLSPADAVCLVPLFSDELLAHHSKSLQGKKPLTVPRQRTTRISTQSWAYSWVGQHGSLGSIDHFPIIDGSYQSPSWGLGWQCMPVNFVIFRAQTSYLRWRVDTGSNIRCHPKRNQLSPALFEEGIYPDVTSRCKQKDNICVAIRSMRKIHNHVKEISDELFIPRFSAYDSKIEELEVKGKSWFIIYFDSATVLVHPLLGIHYQAKQAAENLSRLKQVDTMEVLKYENLARSQGRIELVSEEDGLALRQYCYVGEEAIFSCERLEVGWLFIYLDEKMSKAEAEAYLAGLAVKNTSYVDGKTPRSSSYELLEVAVKQDDRLLLEYIFDPYTAK